MSFPPPPGVTTGLEMEGAAGPVRAPGDSGPGGVEAPGQPCAGEPGRSQEEASTSGGDCLLALWPPMSTTGEDVREVHVSWKLGWCGQDSSDKPEGHGCPASWPILLRFFREKEAGTSHCRCYLAPFGAHIAPTPSPAPSRGYLHYRAAPLQAPGIWRCVG